MKKFILLSSLLLVGASLQAANHSNYIAATEANISSDQALDQKIHDKLSSGYFSKGYDQVNVVVKDGAVTLSGPVQTQADKDKVEKEVRNLDGVKSLTSKITVVEKTNTPNTKYTQDSFGSSADQQLNMKIRDKISGVLWDSYPDVALNTSDGEVTLEGFVTSVKDQQALMNDIRKLDGVKTVKSNLKIKDQVY